MCVPLAKKPRLPVSMYHTSRFIDPAGIYTLSWGSPGMAILPKSNLQSGKCDESSVSSAKSRGVWEACKCDPPLQELSFNGKTQNLV